METDVCSFELLFDVGVLIADLAHLPEYDFAVFDENEVAVAYAGGLLFGLVGG
jgi:hypothetical protein